MSKNILGFILVVSSIFADQNCVTFNPVEQVSRFILVVDVSGSMDGQPLADAQKGLSHFVNNMKANDAAALLAFSDNISVGVSMTSDKSRLIRAIGKLHAGGGTKLYDAIAKAVTLAGCGTGKSAIMALTDGQDGGSRFSSSHVKSMLAHQGAAFFGIGLGSVNDKELMNMARKTDGEFLHTPNSRELTQLYDRALQVYRQKYVSSSDNTAELIAYSMPAGRSVRLDGKHYGVTPLKLSNIPQGNHNLVVSFSAGDWTCDGYYPAQNLGRIEAYESDVDKNVAVLSVPHGSAVFLDEEFQGYTSSFLTGSKTEERGLIFKHKVKKVDYSRELIIQNVPSGAHTITVIPFGGSEAEGISQSYNYKFNMGNQNLVIEADLRKGEAEISYTEEPMIPTKTNRHSIDPFAIPDDF